VCGVCARARVISRAHAAPSSSSSAPLSDGRTKAGGKREGTIFFRMGYLTHWPGQ
jgi:hypothetical protein